MIEKYFQSNLAGYYVLFIFVVAIVVYIANKILDKIELKKKVEDDK